MKFIRARKFRIYPTPEQAHQIDVTLGCCRYVFNHMLERSSKAYARRKQGMSYYDMQNLLPVMKTYLPWLRDADSQALKYACRQARDALGKFITGKAGHPRFKSRKNNIQSYTTTNASSIRVSDGIVRLPILGEVRCNDSRRIGGQILRATVSRKNGRYYASILYDIEKDVEPIEVHDIIGLDYKSDGLYMDSEGNAADMPKYFRRSQQRLCWLQKSLSKRRGSKKGERPSGRFKALKTRIGRLQTHIADQRSDFLHKTSTAIAKRWDAVCVEDLDMRAISQSLKLGKATMDNGFGEFRRMLEYKLAERGKAFVKVGRFYPSTKTCSVCGNIQPMPLGVRVYTCPSCGSVMDRDCNAALNIRAEGLGLIGQICTARHAGTQRAGTGGPGGTAKCRTEGDDALASARDRGFQPVAAQCRIK